MFRTLIVVLVSSGALSAKQTAFVPDTLPCDPDVRIVKTFCPSCDVWSAEFAPDFTGKLPVEYHLSIYNKDSVEIFSTADLEQGWNGSGKDAFEQTQSFRWEIIYRYEKNGTLYRCSDKLVLLQ